MIAASRSVLFLRGIEIRHLSFCGVCLGACRSSDELHRGGCNHFSRAIEFGVCAKVHAIIECVKIGQISVQRSIDAYRHLWGQCSIIQAQAVGANATDREDSELFGDETRVVVPAVDCELHHDSQAL